MVCPHLCATPLDPTPPRNIWTSLNFVVLLPKSLIDYFQGICSNSTIAAHFWSQGQGLVIYQVAFRGNRIPVELRFS